MEMGTIIVDGVQFSIEAIKKMNKTDFLRKYKGRFKNPEKVYEYIQEKLGKPKATPKKED